MNATDRIVAEFNRLVAIGQDKLPDRPHGERVVYFIVATRCEIDMDGFESVYEQAFDRSELSILITGLQEIGEQELSADFAMGLEVLARAGFYEHLNWNKVPPNVKQKIARIGKRIGDRLWDLDEKLVALLDKADTAT